MAKPIEMAADETEIAVTRWANDLREGNSAAADSLWEYLEPRLINLGKRQMQSISKACSDEEDLAQSAFYALCSSIQDGRYQDLADRDEIWKLLVTIALNKFRKRIRHQTAQRRGGKMQQKEFDTLLNSEANTLTAEQSTLLKEECERLLDVLGNDEFRKVALLKVEGYTNNEIANALQCTRRTVQRRLEFIRTVWSRDLQVS